VSANYCEKDIQVEKDSITHISIAIVHLKDLLQQGCCEQLVMLNAHKVLVIMLD
jgi:hypothetical protein